MNSRAILIISSLVFSLTIFAQTTKDKLAYASQLYYSNPDSSFIICDEIAEELKGKNYNELAEAQLCKARYLLLKTNFDKAAKLLNEASTIFEKENNLSRLAKCHSLKSILFGRISEKEKALFHQHKALELYTKVNDTDGQIASLTNISLDFIESIQNDSTLYYLVKLKQFTNVMKEKDKYFLHQNFGTYYYNIADYDASIESYNKASAIAEKFGMIDSKSTVLMLIANSYIAQKNYQLAEQNLIKSIAVASENNLLHEKNEAYIKLIKLYEILGDFKQAYKIEKLNDKIEKEIYNLDKINKINEIETQLKLTEKENIIAQKELEIKDEQLNTIAAESRITQLIFIVALSILIIIFVVIILFRVKKLNNKIESHKKMLEEKNTEITDSITYAKRIQSAILPSISSFKANLPNSFILYLPKDIVAGDFYWMKTVGDNILYAAADCTGHGVPGAMVSVVCSNSLNQSVKELQTEQPSKLLEMTRHLVKESLFSEKGSIMDGMDISLCSINLKEKVLYFSGANNPVYIIRNGELIELKGDKQPIGSYFNEHAFNEHRFELNEGDTIYSFTDGYADQFGGPKGKKFMYKQFKQLLTNLVTEPIDKQQEILNQTFENWKGDLEQIDDVCVIGVKI